MDAARFQANLAGLEDLLFGIGTVEQIRGTQTVTITKINAANLPFNETQTLVEVLDASYPDIVIVAAAVEDGSIATVAANTYAFNGVYLGASDTEPTVDLNGDPLTGGELYFDVSAVDPIDHIMKAYNGASWNPAYGVDIASDSLTFTNKILDDATNYIGANHIHYRVRNESGTTIPKGTVITAAGTQPGTDYIEVVPVSNYLTQVAIGITHSSIENNAVGLATNTGVCSDFTDTSAWDEGTILYPNNSGGLTDVEPTTGRYQACAVVTRSHNTQGTLLVEFSDPTYIASTAQSGVTTLVDDLVTDDNSKALTASQGKALNDKMVFAPQRNTIQLSAAGALVENGTAVDVPSGSVVSFATGKNGTNGNVDKLAITDAHAGITLTASSTNYIYFDYLTPSTVTVGTTTTNVAEGFWVKSLETQAQFKTRIGQTADYYDANEGVMYNSSDVAIERVYVGECEADGTGLLVASSLINYGETKARFGDVIVFGETRSTNTFDWGVIASDATILASSGISSVTTYGTGKYQVTFSVPRKTTTYPVIAASPQLYGIAWVVSRTTTYCKIEIYNTSKDAIAKDFDVLIGWE